MEWRCPECNAVLARPAREAGVLLKGRYVLIDKGQISLGCPQCKNAIQAPDKVRLALVKRATQSFPPSESSPPND